MEATGDRTATFFSPRAPQVQNGGKKKKEKGPRTFDMSKYRQRKIAILLQYSGQQYHGFASQAEGSKHGWRADEFTSVGRVTTAIVKRVPLLRHGIVVNSRCVSTTSNA